MKIGCIIMNVFDAKIEGIRKFNSYEELMEYMRKRYDRWVVQFLNKSCGWSNEYENLDTIEEIKKAVGECDLYIYLIIYNDWIE